MLSTKQFHVSALVFTIFIATPLLADDLTAVNGGVIAVKLPEGVATANYNDENQLVIGNHAIVAIPVEAEIKTHALKVSLEDGSTFNIEFEVIKKKYEEQRIQIDDQSLVTPNEETLERRQKEAAMMRTAYARRSPAIDDILPISLPVEGPRTGVFGTQRFYNDSEVSYSYHSGVDYAAPKGTPVSAPAPGTVVVTHDMYFNGKTVVIDHGSGFISVMCHLDSIDVEMDTVVKRGDVIGTVGSTGRSTGPHLHWTISLQGTKIDPEMFMDVANGLAEESSE
ncbi:MAG: M23 family metallopeptidase [Gammaproteobacteria bacterium]|nr:M23 family metallopeptidase [Gammaproteobacteria bacterium]